MEKVKFAPLIKVEKENGARKVEVSKLGKTIFSIALYAIFILVVFLSEKNLGAFDNFVIALEFGAIYAVIALSMNMTNGFTGIFSLGQAGFMLLGAYVFAIFTIPPEIKDVVYLNGVYSFVRNAYVPIPVAYLIAGAVCALVAYLIGLVVLRFKSDYLAIATIGFIEIVRAVINFLPKATNGSNPLTGIPTFSDMLYKIAPNAESGSVTLCVLICSVCIALMVLVLNSAYGRSFRAVRDDDIAAEAMGINLARTKRISFTISGFFAGIGGAIFAMAQGGSINTSAASFGLDLTYFILLIVVVGGMGSVTGSVIGGFLVYSLREWWLEFCNHEVFIGSVKLPLFGTGFKMLVFAIIILAIVLFFRKGIMGNREFSWNGILTYFANIKAHLTAFGKGFVNFFKNLPKNIKRFGIFIGTNVKKYALIAVNFIKNLFKKNKRGDGANE